jgi:hypothetical protein
VFTGLEVDGTSTVTTGRFGMAEMKREAKTIKVKLSRTDEGWRLLKDDYNDCG